MKIILMINKINKSKVGENNIMNKKYKEKRGITLVTLIITIVLLAILSALTVNAGTQSLSNDRFKIYT